MTPLVEAAHRHRMAVLAALPLEPLEGKTVVDFGTGSWGFACIFPRLQHCRLAIGLDISAEAVRISEGVSANGSFAYGDRYKYYVSDGISIPLPDSSVDVFFSGECIEHVENTDAFLDEIYRVLVSGGTLILTTPNPHPVLYRTFGDLYAVGPEHIALMTLTELLGYLEPRFEVIIIKGYNTSLHTSLDMSVTNGDFARQWAAIHENHPEDACGFIVMGRKKAGWKPKHFSRTLYSITCVDLVKQGLWLDVPLHESLHGLVGMLGSSLALNFFGNEIVILLWSHDWSGIADIAVDQQKQTVDLFSSAGGFRRVIFKDLELGIEHQLTIKPTGAKNPRSADEQVIFFSASAYKCG
jgi:SAM-dependent methyltransferase